MIKGSTESAIWSPSTASIKKERHRSHGSFIKEVRLARKVVIRIASMRVINETIIQDRLPA